jgi:hypothetical protein
MNRNDRLQRVLVRKLIRARLSPPTVAGLLLAWSSLPGLALVGVVGVVALVALGLPSPLPILVAGICLGAALRDAGIAVRAARFWPIQQDLFDWQKIDALAQEGENAPERS